MFSTDVYYEIVRFIPIREMLWFRLVSNEFKDGSESYDRKIIAEWAQFARLNRCFPNAKLTRLRKGHGHDWCISACEDDFDDFIHLSRVDVGSNPLTVNALSKLPHLETLTCYASSRYACSPTFRYSMKLRDLTIEHYYITDQELSYLSNLTALRMTKCVKITSFQSLTSLKKLHLTNMAITDDSLLGMALEDVRLAICQGITSTGIHSLKHLKKLHLINQTRIKDAAFKNMGIEELYVCGTTSLTDRGVCELTKLRILDVQPCSNDFVYIESSIHGNGFKGLCRLQCLSLRGATITNCSDFEQVDELRLSQCYILKGNFNVWKKIGCIELSDTEGCASFDPFDHPAKRLVIQNCPGIMDFQRYH